MEIYQGITYITNLQKWFPFTHICVHKFVEIEWHRNHNDTTVCCYTHGPQNHAHIFYHAWFATLRLGTSLANFGFALYQNQLIHVIRWFKNSIPGIARSGHWGATCLAHWLIPVAHKGLRSHNAWYIMLTSLNTPWTWLNNQRPNSNFAIT